MGAHYHTNLVLLEELVDDVGPVAHNVVLLLRVTNRVRLHAEDFVGGCWVTPHQIHAHLLHCVRDVAEVHSKGPLDLVNVFKLDNGVADTTMDAKDTVLGRLVRDEGTKGHPLE